jgi:hypothetical protein
MGYIIHAEMIYANEIFDLAMRYNVSVSPTLISMMIME